MSERQTEPPPRLGRDLLDDLDEELAEQRLAGRRGGLADPVTSLRRHHRPRPAGSLTRARSRRYRAELPAGAEGLVPAGPAAVLARAGAAREARLRAEVEELAAAAEWAALHRVASPTDAPGGEREVDVAGEGAPRVAEFAIPELALRLGVSTESGRSLIADAVELVHRLPRCWEALRSGGIPAYRARRVAQATRDLNPAAAGYVDEQVAPYLHAVGVRALEGIVAAAVWRHDLPRALTEAGEALDRRGITVDLTTPVGVEGTTSTCQVSGHLDRADAVELETALAHLAHQLLLAGSTQTLDVRRSQALGMLARREAPVDLPDLRPDPDLEEWDPAPRPEPVQVHPRRVVLHVHVGEAALRGAPGLARLEGHDGPVTTEQVRAWCAAPGATTHVTVKPVIDLAATLTVGSYEVPDRVAEQVALRDRTCVFPHCARDARCCDCDHVVAHCRCGPTSTANLAPLCRRHHRLKTHGESHGWGYRVLHPGTYLWTTPRGQQVLRDPGGTHTLG